MTPASTFPELFTVIRRRKVGGGSKSCGADEHTFFGFYAGQRVVLRTRPRQKAENMTFYISSNQRLRTSGHDSCYAAEFVDVQVLEGRLGPEQLEQLRALMQACDSRQVLIRVRGEGVR